MLRGSAVIEGRGYMPPSASDEWTTPIDLYRSLDQEFGFSLDPCTSAENPLGASSFLTAAEDGLAADWGGHIAFVNPPYSALKAWIAKAARETAAGGCEAVCLIPARSDTSMWHDLVMPVASEVRLIRGRLKFGGATAGAPFPSCLVVFQPGRRQAAGPRFVGCDRLGRVFAGPIQAAQLPLLEVAA